MTSEELQRIKTLLNNRDVFGLHAEAVFTLLDEIEGLQRSLEAWKENSKMHQEDSKRYKKALEDIINNADVDYHEWIIEIASTAIEWEEDSQ